MSWKDNPTVTPLHVAAGDGNLGLVSNLLDCGAPCGAEVDRADDMGATALFYAAAGGKLDVMALLLDRGANADARLKSGHNPAGFAERLGQASAKELLLFAMAVKASKKPMPFRFQDVIELPPIRQKRASGEPLTGADFIKVSMLMMESIAHSPTKKGRFWKR